MVLRVSTHILVYICICYAHFQHVIRCRVSDK